jgi:hypothetical protein
MTHAGILALPVELPFHVELWDSADSRVAELIAACSNLVMAKAAFHAAAEMRPGANLLLRDRARVVARSKGR